MRTCLCLNYQVFLNSPPTTLPLNARAASSLLLSLIIENPPNKFKLKSLLSYQLSPFVIPFRPRPSLAKLDSLMAPRSKDRLRGMLECLSPSNSAILKREQTAISARAADLLACPPHLVDKNGLSCSFQPGLTLEPLGTDARHFARCRKGLRLHGAVSDRVRDEPCFILERCRTRIIAERLGSHRQMPSFRRREGAFLLKTPDLVIPDLDGPPLFHAH